MVGTGGPVDKFSVWDYVVFAGLVVGAAGIGLVQAFRGRKDSSSDEFLLGGRQMTAVPVAMSLTASFMSGVTVIGTPAEAYVYGTPFWLFAFSYAIMSTISAEIFVPLFYRLGITSTYEVRDLSSKSSNGCYCFCQALYTGVVIYAPALALNQITGLDLWGVLVATGVVCIIYCTLGGLKAVIWTDVFQMVIMLSGFVAVIARGAVLQGGLGKIWEDNYKTGRLNTFDFDPDPLRRHTFWTIVVGGSLMWVSIYSINQSQVQRYVSCRTMTHAKMSLYVNMVGLWITVSLAVFSGLTMYSVYKNCDPLTNKDVASSDQLLPYLVMDMLAKYPGVPGLFVAAAYSGTLSTVSSSINALVAVTVEDFVKPLWPSMTEKQVSWINMGMSKFHNCNDIGPLLGLFLLGMFFRCANSTGGVAGLIISLCLTLWVGIGAQLYPPHSAKTRPLPLTVDGLATWSSAVTPLPPNNERPALADSWYSLSYLYFCPLGTLVTLISGLIISAISGGCKQEKIRPELLIRKEDFICFSCCRKDENSAPDLIQKVGPDQHYGLDNPYFTDLELKPTEKDRDFITKL
uniref:Solute carrier family 5 member 8 n=1 Tax=Pygocentrus nattereri TaxID=42514 RepID=A0A3B4BXE9_PYGNA